MKVEKNIGRTGDKPDLVRNKDLVSREVHDKIEAAFEEIRETDQSEDQLAEVIRAYKKARSNLQYIVDEPGVSSHRAKEIIESLNERIDLMNEILTGISEARRKLTILNNNSPVPEPKLKQLANNLIKASEAAEKLGRDEPKIEKYREELAEHSSLFVRLSDKPYSITIDESTDGTASDSKRSSSTEGSNNQNDSKPDKSDKSEQKASRDELIAELHRLKGTVGGMPEKVHIQKFSQYPPDDFESEFGSLHESINAAFSFEEPASETSPVRTDTNGEQTRSPTKQTDKEKKQSEPTRDDLLDEFERVGDQLGKRPTTSEFDEHSQYEPDDVYEYFDSWSAIVETSEIEAATRDELLDDLRRLESDLGAPPLSSHIDDQGRFSAYDYRMEFGSVEDALEEAGYDIESRVLEILGEVIDESDGKPKMTDFSSASPYRSNNIYKWFGSWDEALGAAKENKKTTGEVDALTTEHGSTVQDITQNELSEIYELVRNLRTLTNVIIMARDEVITGESDKSTDPMTSWAETVDELWRGNNTSEPNYGSQQSNRNPFSMAEYRQAFGNGDRVTEFECASARRLSPTVAALIEPHLDADPETFYLPVDPDSSTPVPVIVESKDALRRASEMLHCLPKQPEAAAPATSSRAEADGSNEEDNTDTTPGELLEVSGVTDSIAEALHTAGHRTREDLRATTMEELTTVDGISEQLAMRIKLDVGE